MKKKVEIILPKSKAVVRKPESAFGLIGKPIKAQGKIGTIIAATLDDEGNYRITAEVDEDPYGIFGIENLL